MDDEKEHVKFDDEEEENFTPIPNIEIQPVVHKDIPIFDFMFVIFSCIATILTAAVIYALTVLYFLMDCYIIGIITISLDAAAILLISTYRFGSPRTAFPHDYHYYVNILKILFHVEPLIMGFKILSESLRRDTNRTSITDLLMLATENSIIPLMEFNLLIAALQCVPQVILQVWAYTYLTGKDLILLQNIQLCHIFLTTHIMAWFISTALPFDEKFSYKPNSSVSVVVLKIVIKYNWMLCLITSRILVLFGVAEVFGWWLAPICGLQWLIMYIWIIVKDPCQQWSTYNNSKTWDSIIYKPAIILIFLFAFIHPHKGCLSNSYGVYNTSIFLLSIGLLYMTYAMHENPVFIVYPNRYVCFFIFGNTYYFLRKCLATIYTHPSDYT